VWNIVIDSRKLEARLRLSQSLSDIVQSVADAAVPQIMPCPRCKATGRTGKGEKETECPKCDGIGQVLRPADKESQKMALEMGELLNQRVPLIAQQFNSYKGGGADAGAPDMTDWTRSTDPLFEEHGRTGVTEAEVVNE
jgi:hypothetical protein